MLTTCVFTSRCSGNDLSIPVWGVLVGWHPSIRASAPLRGHSLCLRVRVWPMDMVFFFFFSFYEPAPCFILMSIQNQHLKIGRLHIKIRTCDFSFEKKLDHLVTLITLPPYLAGGFHQLSWVPPVPLSQVGWHPLFMMPLAPLDICLCESLLWEVSTQLLLVSDFNTNL